MIGIVMAGGRGTRMESDREKLLLAYKKPVILHVIDALACSGCLEKILALTSPNSPETGLLLDRHGVTAVRTPGDGYARDLNSVLRRLDGPVLVASGDMPLLDSGIIRDIAAAYDPRNAWTSFVAARRFSESLGFSSGPGIRIGDGEYCHTGISLVNAGEIQDLSPVLERHVILNDRRIACNLNTRRDYESLGAL